MMRRWMHVTTLLTLLLAAPWPAQAIQWGAGTGTSYPTTLDTANNRTNVGGGACSSATTTNICKEWLNDWQGATIAIMTELGTLPKGSYADVKTRLNAGVYSGTAGLSSYVAGDLLYASNTTTLARLAGVATGNVLRAGGVGVAPAWGQVVLTTDVSGILPGANGGTGNGFFAVSGPASSLKTFTLPNVSETIATLGQAETFSALKTFSAGIVSPSLIGGTGTTSTLSLQSTSGVGAAGADIIFKVGNNGATEAMRILNSGNVGIGTTAPSDKLEVTGGAIRASGNGAGSEAFVSPFNRLNSFGGGTIASTILAVRSNGAANVPLLIRGAASQTADLFQVQNSTPTSLFVINPSGNLGIGTTSPASLLDLRAGDLTMSGANGQKYVQGVKTELTTIAAAATTATTLTIPANAILKAVEMRVTVQPPGTSTMVVTATTSGTILQQGASMSTAINTTDVGTRAWGTNYVGVAAQTITITPDVTPSDNTGRVRFTIYYDEPTAPTS